MDGDEVVGDCICVKVLEDECHEIVDGLGVRDVCVLSIFCFVVWLSPIAILAFLSGGCDVYKR